MNDNMENLTTREKEVLGLAMFGLKIPQIAQKLVISENTIKNHFNSIYSKLNVHNRVQAVIKYLKLGGEAKLDSTFSNEYNIALKELMACPPIRDYQYNKIL